MDEELPPMDRSWRAWLWLLVSVAGVCSLGFAALTYVAGLIHTSTGGSRGGGVRIDVVFAGLGVLAGVAGVVGFVRARAAERRRLRALEHD